jgi:glycerophosphoryl diester phosphodiesterase
MSKVLNIAHRGFSSKYPENTMIAFEKAVEENCDGIETDLNMTKDGVIVICHDETLNRTTNGSGYIKDYTYKELSKLDAGTKFSDKFKDQRIITIDELLDYVKDKNILLNLELKNDLIHYENLEEKTIEKIYEYRLQDNVILSSFNHYSMLKVKELDNNIKTGLLYCGTIYNAYEYAKKLNADALHPYYPAVMNKKIVDEIKENSIAINTYTVNEEIVMKKLIKLGVDGIITNYPDKLNEILKRDFLL